MVSYQELRDLYIDITEMSDDEFMSKISEILHAACIIAWFKELGSDATISDVGIIHQLVHLLHIPDEPTIILSEIREQFNALLELK